MGGSSVALTLITTFGNWTFQYFSLRAEAEKTNRELRIKEKEMQLKYLEQFTQTAIDQDITKRIRLAHYISSTIDDKEYVQLAKNWAGYYKNLVDACNDRAKAAAAGSTSEQLQCAIGGTFQITAPVKSTPIPVFVDSTGGGGVLGELIARVESGKAGYGAYNRGSLADAGEMDFSKLTVGEVIALQALPQGDPKKLFAVGKYGLIPSAMKAAVANLKIDENTKFTPALQERLFRNYLVAAKRPAIKGFITGSNPTDTAVFSAQVALALEFAAVARPDSGLSHYGAGAPALIKPEQTAQALFDEFAAYHQNLAKGMSPDAAWSALSPGIDQVPVSDKAKP